LFEQGNAARVVFKERAAAEAAVAAYELSQDMRVTIPADKKYRLFQKVGRARAHFSVTPPARDTAKAIHVSLITTFPPPLAGL
jgi:hypothetical protein